MRSPNPRLWSTKAKAINLGVLLLVLVGGAILFARLSHNPWPQSLAAVVALSSLVATAVAAYNAFARSRRKDTLAAFSLWSDKHYPVRVALSKQLGSHRISREQALALVTAAPLNDKNGAPLSQEDKQQAREQICEVLNGLERLATGVNLGIYDERVLRKIGGTIIVRTYERFEPYIRARHSEAAAEGQQSKAYEQLAILVKILDMPRLDATRKNMRDDIDRGRLEALR
ncbi:DUF4760 domain-containing protein [Rhodococcus sp. T7]|uniref:DUF4760 domain-containing protein n=1 Tax=Rhodococcus sp. T7 TaxID=627444 RepID=UPI00135950D5|nr:DUF4760 domain-containing protein [Rhodococcus sp. T7]KAF0957319.1 hypothetical protein MLGJGCBP_09149 [Rhodococcus sp. T7]KAF0959188.1 hypothetical protein MLGJGCBP_07701 [Rhodococcus sp. T7]